MNQVLASSTQSYSEMPWNYMSDHHNKENNASTSEAKIEDLRRSLCNLQAQVEQVLADHTAVPSSRVEVLETVIEHQGARIEALQKENEVLWSQVQALEVQVSRVSTYVGPNSHSDECSVAATNDEEDFCFHERKSLNLEINPTDVLESLHTEQTCMFSSASNSSSESPFLLHVESTMRTSPTVFNPEHSIDLLDGSNADMDTSELSFSTTSSPAYHRKPPVLEYSASLDAGSSQQPMVCSDMTAHCSQPPMERRRPSSNRTSRSNQPAPQLAFSKHSFWRQQNSKHNIRKANQVLQELAGLLQI